MGKLTKKNEVFCDEYLIDLNATQAAIRAGYSVESAGSIGSEQGGLRPVVVIQNDKGNRFSPTLIVAPISSRLTKPPIPTHVILPADSLEKASIVLLEQIRTIDKKRLKEKICHLNDQVMERVDQCVLISLGLAASERQN